MEFFNRVGVDISSKILKNISPNYNCEMESIIALFLTIIIFLIYKSTQHNNNKHLVDNVHNNQYINNNKNQHIRDDKNKKLSDDTNTYNEKQTKNSSSSVNKIIVKYCGADYDITDFVRKHPGGKKVLIDSNGKDIEQLMLDNEHSNHAYKLLSKYKINY